MLHRVSCAPIGTKDARSGGRGERGDVGKEGGGGEGDPALPQLQGDVRERARIPCLASITPARVGGGEGEHPSLTSI